jgi:hypothetical protein
MRAYHWVAALLALGAGAAAHAQCAGYYESDYAEATYYDTGYLESGSCAEVPNVLGQATSADADLILEGVGLDAGTVTARCSSATADEVIDQAPPAGTFVELGSLIALFTSNGTPCEGRPPLWLHVERGRLR